MNACLEPLNHNQNARNNEYAARIPRVRTESGKKAFWFQGPKLYNELPSSLRQIDSFLIFIIIIKFFKVGIYNSLYTIANSNQLATKEKFTII